MTEEEKFFVHKYSGYYYTENRIPVSGKVLFEGTEKECYEFVKKETEDFLGKKTEEIEIPEGVEEIKWQRKNLKNS